jgi:hypothetical protein
MQKYTGCVNFAGILTREQAEEIAGMVWDLDKMKDVSELCHMLTFIGRR